jgi:hypothetical protein
MQKPASAGGVSKGDLGVNYVQSKLVALVAFDAFDPAG